MDRAFDRAVEKDRKELLVRRDVVPVNTYNLNILSLLLTLPSNMPSQISWNVLRNDSVLGPLLPEAPAVLFRGAPPLRLQVAINIIDPPIRIAFFRNIFFSPCRKGFICQIDAERL